MTKSIGYNMGFCSMLFFYKAKFEIYHVIVYYIYDNCNIAEIE